jgi:hypothetical protein
LTSPEEAGGEPFDECAEEPEEFPESPEDEEGGEEAAPGVPDGAGAFDVRDGDGLCAGFGGRLVGRASALASCVEPAAVMGRARGGS